MAETLSIDSGWSRFRRWGPYALLGLSALMTAVTAPQTMSRTAVGLAGGLTAAALVWQLLWDRHIRKSHVATRGRILYFTVRTVLALALSMLNPFFSIFAVMGYFDADRHLPRPLRRWGLVATAVALAVAQTSVRGPLPEDLMQWSVFGALLLLHTSLALMLDRFNDQAADERRRRETTIAELASALTESDALQAQLLVQAQEAGREDERRRLAAEIHDTLAQGLAGIITQLQAAADSADRDSAHEHVVRAAALARHSLGEARRSVHNLAPAALERHGSLPEALRTTVDRWSATSSARAELTVIGSVGSLHGEIEATLLKVTGEALANVAKHACADRVGVTLSYFADEVTLDVRDDGLGFDPGSVAPRSAVGGFGLSGMRSRVVRLAGDFAVESQPGGGTAIAVRVPLVRDAS